MPLMLRSTELNTLDVINIIYRVAPQGDNILINGGNSTVDTSVKEYDCNPSVFVETSSRTMNVLPSDPMFDKLMKLGTR